LDQPALVAGPDQNQNQICPTPTIISLSASSSPSSSTSPIKETRTSSINYLFSAKLINCSENAQLVARASLAQSTIKQYSAHAEKFIQFLEQQKVADSDISEVDLVNFISNYVLKKVSHSYVRQLYASALRVASHRNPLISIDNNLLAQVFAGAKNLCAIPKSKQVSWDPNEVLDYLKSISVPSSLQSLAAECALLLALSSALRASDLNRLGVDCVVHRDVFSIPFLEKTKTGFREPVSIKPFIGSDRICPFLAFMRYVKASREFCKDNSIVREKFLFVSATTGKRVKVPTIRNWIVNLLSQAGVLASAGSTRSAAASSAWWQGLPFDSIAKMAGWKHESTFQKFYNRPIVFSGVNLMQV
jgi:integrase